MTLRLSALVALLLLPLAVQADDHVTTLTAPDGTTVDIVRDEYGVPRIYAQTETGGFYAQGWAVAQDRLFQMETFWRVATGRMAELMGPDALETDIAIRTVFYTPAERAQQFSELPPEVQSMMDAYIAGINAYIALAQAQPAEYLPFEYTQFPLNAIGIETWDRDKAVAVMQFFMRRFGEIGGNELARLAELQAFGPAWFEANRPINDPAAYTSLWGAASKTFSQGAASPEAAFDVDPDIVQSVADRQRHVEAQLREWGVPHKLGSFAALVRPEATARGAAMLLGAPQMGEPSPTAKAVTSEVEIRIAGGLHIAGMTVPGIPGVIIGRNGSQDDQRAWTLTTGFTDNTDTYAEVLTGPSSYFYNGESQDFEVIVDQINVLGGAPVTYPHFRTVHGPVYAQDAENGLAFSWRYTFWDRELEMVEAFYTAWKSTSLADWEAVAADIPMSFNLFYADTDQNLAYWHVGSYPVRPVDPRLPASGVGTEEWLGFVDFADQPQAVNFEQPYLVNWNNKPAAGWPQGDNVPWTDTPPSGYTRVFDGARSLEDHLTASTSQGGITFEEVQQLTRVVRQNPQYPEYPGTYQQVLAFLEGDVQRAENVIPPGQSGFISASGVPSPHFADQWGLYTSSEGNGPILMKDYTFSADVEGSLTPQSIVVPPGETSRITFTFRSRNTTDETQEVVAYGLVQARNGAVYGPILPAKAFSLSAGEATGPTRVGLTVPRFAPPGMYTLISVVEDAETGEIIDQDGFDFKVGRVATKASGEAAERRATPEAMLPLPAGWEAVELGPADAPLAEAAPEAIGAAFPNPALGTVSVPLTLASDATVRLTVVDALGREVLATESDLRAGEQRATLDASGLAAGVYVLRVDTGATVRSQRLVIAR